MKVLQNEITGTQISFATNFGGELSFILSFNFSYWDLINFPYFVDTTERGDKGWKQAQRQDEDRVTFHITLLYCMFELVKADGGPPNRECVDMLKKSNTYTKEIS